MKQQQQATKILQILKETLPLPAETKKRRSPFEVLVVTIISQNTADRNTHRAFETLSNRFAIRPDALSKATQSEIEAAIRTAGLHKSKAKTIKQAAKTILEQYRDSMQTIFQLPLEEARAALMQIQGVGPKTADVVLLFSAGQPTVPVDTHVNRVSKRLGLAPENSNYEVVRKSLQAIFQPPNYLAVHLLLIEHGRRTCKAQRPRCNECPLGAFCPSCGKWSKQ